MLDFKHLRSLRFESGNGELTASGPRRFAEIMLEEAEVLALRFPERAQRYLEEASLRFIEVCDTVGCVVAAVCSETAALRAGSVAALTQSTDMKAIYDKLASDINLPSFNEIATWARNRDAPLEQLNRGSWTGWLQRLFRVLAGESSGVMSDNS